MAEIPEHASSMEWVEHGERPLYENPWVTLTKVDVTPPDGNRFEHHAVRLQHVAACAVVRDGKVLMTYRHRFITRSWGWELPGGIVDAGEEPALTAVRETEEETGWRPGPVRLLADFQPMPGLVDTPHSVYVADGAELVGEPSDPVEVGVVRWVDLADLRGLLAAGELGGAGTIVGVLAVLAGTA
ncbi:8-oxo-dGTP pyrophosphatase MutT (NUDIX family) [Tsukamurella ocularis]|uniref:NUDIX hydrolase n=1 Tax=Tsukamurella ocularis TaxID=1970234 RepID=UPI00216909E8|nr:NUDIX hydrolase [Tsukamurella ocularis]MCS3790016.1 8-oxo-dGTP pyrophosphatase MutT (NUDIX family) [Tsukamurella ocularis]